VFYTLKSSDNLLNGLRGYLSLTTGKFINKGKKMFEIIFGIFGFSVLVVGFGEIIMGDSNEK